MNKKKTIKFCFALWCATVFSISVFGHTLESDLKWSFNKFSVVRINNREALRKAKSGIPLNVQFDGKNFQFVLKFNDVRSADYKAEYTDQKGRYNLPKGEVFTYQGTIVGHPHSLVALTIDGTKIEGYFATKTEDFFIESAKNYSFRASDNEQVIYRVEDKVDGDDNVHGLDEMMTEGIKNINSDVAFNTVSNTQTGRRVLKVATEADKKFVLEQITGNGDPAKANAHILSVMNQVDAVYRRDLNLRVVVTFQHAWMPGTEDPYGDLINGDLLYAFSDYWSVNFPKSNLTYRRDVSHLFTSRIGNRGQAIRGRVCRENPEASSFTSNLSVNKWTTVAHELGHNLGASHTDVLNPPQSSCASSIMDPGATSRTGFCQYSIDEITSFINIYGGSCLDFDSTVNAPLFDFDGDGIADISVFRPDNGMWYLLNSQNGFSAAQFGISIDKLVSADYDGDGKTDIAVYRGGIWYLLRSSTGFTGFAFGDGNDIPQPADFDGDGKADLAVWRPSNGTWYIFNLATNQFSAYQFGASTDKPVASDYDGDGKADYAVYRPSNGTWYVQRSQLGFTGIQFGDANDKPVPADYDGDGKTDIAVYRPSNGTWYLNRSQTGFTGIQFGIATDLPTPADYDGDGKVDVAVYRDGTWYLNQTTAGFTGVQFGASTDKPVPNAFIR